MQGVFKKAAVVFFIGLFAAALFSLGEVRPTRINTAQASFLDIIIGLVSINPLNVRVSVPAEVELERNFTAQVTVENKGEERIRDLKTEIFISEGLVLVNKNTVKTLGTLNGKSTRSVSWQVQGTQVGNFSISASVSGQVREDTISAQGNTALVAVGDASPPPRPRPSIFTRLRNFFRGWF